MNVLGLLLVALYELQPTHPWTPKLYNVIFAYANGPLGLAVVVWSNAMVFHDIDRLSSLFLHILPSVLTFCMRFADTAFAPGAAFDSQFDWESMMLVTLSYMFWQLGYLLLTEVVFRQRLADNPKMATSLRWLSTDARNGMNRMVLKLCRSWGVMESNENFDHATIKTKSIFITAQATYTAMGMVIVPFTYHWWMLHYAFILVMVAVAAYNGGNYYVEVKSFACLRLSAVTHTSTHD